MPRPKRKPRCGQKRAKEQSSVPGMNLSWKFAGTALTVAITAVMWGMSRKPTENSCTPPSLSGCTFAHIPLFFDVTGHDYETGTLFFIPETHNDLVEADLQCFLLNAIGQPGDIVLTEGYPFGENCPDEVAFRCEINPEQPMLVWQGWEEPALHAKAIKLSKWSDRERERISENKQHIEESVRSHLDEILRLIDIILNLKDQENKLHEDRGYYKTEDFGKKVNEIDRKIIIYTKQLDEVSNIYEGLVAAAKEVLSVEDKNVEQANRELIDTVCRDRNGALIRSLKSVLKNRPPEQHVFAIFGKYHLFAQPNVPPELSDECRALLADFANDNDATIFSPK